MIEQNERARPEHCAALNRPGLSSSTGGNGESSASVRTVPNRAAKKNLTDSVASNGGSIEQQCQIAVVSSIFMFTLIPKIHLQINVFSRCKILFT